MTYSCRAASGSLSHAHSPSDGAPVAAAEARESATITDPIAILRPPTSSSRDCEPLAHDVARASAPGNNLGRWPPARLRATLPQADGPLGPLSIQDLWSPIGSKLVTCVSATLSWSLDRLRLAKHVRGDSSRSAIACFHVAGGVSESEGLANLCLVRGLDGFALQPACCLAIALRSAVRGRRGCSHSISGAGEGTRPAALSRDEPACGGSHGADRDAAWPYRRRHVTAHGASAKRSHPAWPSHENCSRTRPRTGRHRRRSDRRRLWSAARCHREIDRCRHDRDLGRGDLHCLGR